MLITHFTGDCPACGAKVCFGNVAVRGDHVLQGCARCKHSARILLPKIRKKILYLDQFFFSGAFRKGDPRFIEAAQRISQLSSAQLLIAPFSSIHEDETQLWRGYDGKSKDELMEFIKATARGHEFSPAWDVERTQIIRAFRHFLVGNSEIFELKDSDAVDKDIHDWDDYFRIDVGHYVGDIELMRDLKQESVETLIDVFPSWRNSTNTFDQDVMLEMQAAVKAYIDFYLAYIKRVAEGDPAAYLDSPITAHVVEAMFSLLPEEIAFTEKLTIIARFFISSHFEETPYHWLSARIFATQKDMVKRGAYRNRDRALKRLGGFFQDVKHISIYAPYCDGFVIDKPMSSLVTDPRVDLENRYKVKVFSLNNWDDFLCWLDSIEAGMSSEHKAGLAVAYPKNVRQSRE